MARRTLPAPRPARPAQPPRPPRRRPRKRDWVAAGIALIVVAALVVSGLFPFFYAP
ncbi:MAG: hypothetical protein VKQ33_11085 [Candidatus Sericytochromatia bacterium]|nr:hypothetical protein [Candidatus Sericytochromatia bacterium]